MWGRYTVYIIKIGIHNVCFDSELDAYEELADVVRKNVDIARVCEIIGIDV